MRSRRESGQMLPFIGMLIVVLLAFAGFAADVGALRYQQRIQQNATDKAAVAGANELVFGGSDSAITSVVNATASADGFTSGVVMHHGPADGRYVSNTGAVQVVITQNRPVFFMNAGNWPGIGPTVTVTTKAVGLVTNSTNCIIMLSPTQTSTWQAKINAPTCGVAINNSNIDVHGSNKITVASFDYAGSLNQSGHPFDLGQPEASLPVADPCPQIPACAAVPAATGPVSTVDGTFTGSAPAGYYRNLTLGGGKKSSGVALSGTYVIDGSLNISAARLTGTNVVFYLRYSAPGSHPALNINGSDLTGLTNPVFYQPTSTVGVVTDGSPLGGLLYFPKAPLTINGNANNNYTLMIFASSTLNGSGTGLSFPAPPTNGARPQRAVLAE